jgi:hypothetical protein
VNYASGEARQDWTNTQNDNDADYNSSTYSDSEPGSEEGKSEDEFAKDNDGVFVLLH